ncbi:MAG: hypothetical protein SF069_18180 [Phycisphaerae bacterium]|nr:hypothetical protein [Phycisphaerae bacterium]
MNRRFIAPIALGSLLAFGLPGTTGCGDTEEFFEGIEELADELDLDEGGFFYGNPFFGGPFGGFGGPFGCYSCGFDNDFDDFFDDLEDLFD